MKIKIRLLLSVLLGFCFLNISWAYDTTKIEIRMPNVQPSKNDEYLHTSKKLQLNETYYIVKFEPNASMNIVHHMILRGCEQVLAINPDDPKCIAGEQLLYAWAKNAPDLILPDNVGFKIGSNSNLEYLILEVHYGNISNINPNSGDISGVRLVITNEPQPKRAGVFILATGGSIKPHTTDYYETACEYKFSISLYPFAFRTHTHNRGVVVNGYNVIKNSNGTQTWQLIGKKNPQLPQFFYPVKNRNIVIQPGNLVAGRCKMRNNENRTINVGSTHMDEMCNFYVMYYVEGDILPQFSGCYNSGPPWYYWSNDPTLNNVPGDDNSM